MTTRQALTKERLKRDVDAVERTVAGVILESPAANVLARLQVVEGKLKDVDAEVKDHERRISDLEKAKQ